MKINEGIENLDEKLLFERTAQLSMDMTHTAKQHMKAILKRQAYNELKPTEENLEYSLAIFNVGSLADKINDLSNDLTEKYFPKYEVENGKR